MTGIIPLRAARAPGATGFDYTVLSPNDAALVRRAADKIHQHQQRTSAEIIDIGADLIKVKEALKEALGRGHFGNWLRTEFDWTARTAQRYMQAAVVFGGKTDTVSHLAPATIYKLSAPSVPETIVADVVAKLEHGAEIDWPMVEEKIETARTDAKTETKKKQAQHRRRGLSPETLRRQVKEEAERATKQRQRRERAEAVAHKLVEEVGLAVVLRVRDALQDFYVDEALRKMKCAAEDGIPSFLDRRATP